MGFMFWGILRDALPLIPIALAIVWTLRYLRIADFSLAGSFSIAAGITASLVEHGLSPALAIGISLLSGLTVALLMALSVYALKLEALLASIIVLFIVYSLSLLVTQGTITIKDSVNPLESIRLLESSLGLSTTPVLETLALAGIAAFCTWATDRLLSSEWGCAFRALEDPTGGKTFVESLGLSPAHLGTAGLCVGGVLASLSGVIVAFRDGQATTSLGLDVMIEIVPAYLLGLALFESRPRPGFYMEASRVGILKLNLLFRRTKFARPSLAAGLGVITFFAILNGALLWVHVESLPRVFIGLIILLMLGSRPAFSSFKYKLSQAKSTQIVEPNHSLLVEDLSVIFPTLEGPRTVILNSTFEVSSGQIAKIEGPNGVGKTTALRALAGLIECTGRFKIPSSKLVTRDRKRLVAYLSQDARETTVDTLTVAEHAVLCRNSLNLSPFKSWGKTAKLAVSLINSEVAKRNCGALVGWLSGGERRNLLLGLLALQTNLPWVICFDEPFAYLDQLGQQECRKLIREVASRGRIVLFVDHQNNIEPEVVISALPSSQGTTLALRLRSCGGEGDRFDKAMHP
jgi:ABC-type Mn2+/Zn2+ transport system ATPase subunit/ABC-type uncharacterized transport system permease subunit